MNKALNIIIIICLTVIVVLVSTGLGTMPQPKGIDSCDFSAERVALDIEKISQEPHSLYTPESRKHVEQYLTSRLTQLGFTPEAISYHHSDTTFNDTITLTNLYLTIDPEDTIASSYIMLIAHYNSAKRYSTRTKEKESSYGAADDGYGVGVILEVLKLAISNRNECKQGIKILLTDGEEFGMLGMKRAWNENNQFFDHTGLIINIEARGVKGVALLFETSKGSSHIIDLYSKTDYPAAFSLSSTVYDILPNYTDFTMVKNEMCGVNFSVIDNLYYYHTRDDSFANISKSSIQHYGEQIYPMVDNFMTEGKYSNPDYFRHGQELIYFTVPLIGLIVMSKIAYMSINILTLILLFITLYLVRQHITIKGIVRYMVLALAAAVGFALVGTLIAYIYGLIFDVKFKFTNMLCSGFDYPLMCIYFALVAVTIYIFISKIRERIIEFQTSAILLNCSFVMLTMVVFPDNFIILIPSLVSIIALIARIALKSTPLLSRIISYIGYTLILLVSIPIINHLTVGLAVGALGMLALLATLILTVTIPLVINPQNNRRRII